MGRQPSSRGKPAPPSQDGGSDARLLRRVLLVAAVAAAALLVWQLSHILLLLFAAILVAMILRTVAEPFERFARLPARFAVLAALASLLVAMALGGWLFGREVSSQTTELTERLPQAWEAARGQLATLPFGSEVVERLDALLSRMGLTEGPEGAAPAEGGGGGLTGGLFADVGAFAGLVASAVAEFVLVIFAGLFLALNPESYKAGTVRLFERKSDGAAAVVGKAFDVSGTGLRRWLLGQLAAMVAVGVVTGVGAWIIGLPSPLALGMIAGVLEFVPILGPIAATIPALLLAAMMGPEMVLWTLLLYLAIQQVEGNLIMPIIQKRMVSLPPVISLFAILVFGALFGPLGVIMATPLAVVLFVLVKGVYLDEPISTADAWRSGR